MPMGPSLAIVFSDLLEILCKFLYAAQTFYSGVMSTKWANVPSAVFRSTFYLDRMYFDYCISLYRSLSSFNMHKLQCIQNTHGRIIINCNRYSRASPILKKLHSVSVYFKISHFCL